MDTSTLHSKTRRSGSGSKVRKRMSDCLSDLATVLPVNSYNSSRGKLDKIEVVQLAVKYLSHMNEVNYVNSKNPQASLSHGHRHVCEFMKLSEEDRMKEFTRGFNESINQTVQYLNKHLDIRNNSTFIVKLVNHLLGNLELITDKRSSPPGVNNHHNHSNQQSNMNNKVVEKVDVDIQTVGKANEISQTPVESAQLLSSPPPPSASPVDISSPIYRREISTQTFVESKRSSTSETTSKSSANNQSSVLTTLASRSNCIEAINQLTERITSERKTPTSSVSLRKQDVSVLIGTPAKEGEEGPQTGRLTIQQQHELLINNSLIRKETPIKTLTTSSPSEVNSHETNKSFASSSFPSINPIINEQIITRKSLSSDSLASPLSSSASYQSSVSPCIDLTGDANTSNTNDVTMETAKVSEKVCETLKSKETPTEGAAFRTEDAKSCISFKKRINMKYQIESKNNSDANETPTLASDVSVSRKSIDNSSTLRTLLISDQDNYSNRCGVSGLPPPPKLTVVRAHQTAHENAFNDQIMIKRVPNQFYHSTNNQHNQHVIDTYQRRGPMKAPSTAVNDALSRSGWETYQQTPTQRRHINQHVNYHPRLCCPHPPELNHRASAVRSHPYPKTPPYPFRYQQSTCPVINRDHNQLNRRVNVDANSPCYLIPSPIDKCCNDSVYLNHSNHHNN